MGSLGEGGFWLFGYGSLIWKPPPHFDIRQSGYIENYVRRFWQASEDHRGTPEAPGRVVTLINLEDWKQFKDVHSNAPARVWGAAYHIPAEHVAEVREYLDIREINGYSAQFTPFHAAAEEQQESAPTEPFDCLVYIGLPSNPQFVGPQDPDTLARHILASRGPSGENREYLYALADSLAGLSEESGDEHVSDLAARCRALEREGAKVAPPPSKQQEYVDQFTEPLHKAGTADEQEEVEKPGV